MNTGDKVKINTKLKNVWFGTNQPDIYGTVVTAYDNGMAKIEMTQTEKQVEWLLPKQYLVVPINRLEQA